MWIVWNRKAKYHGALLPVYVFISFRKNYGIYFAQLNDRCHIPNRRATMYVDRKYKQKNSVPQLFFCLFFVIHRKYTEKLFFHMYERYCSYKFMFDLSEAERNTSLCQVEMHIYSIDIYIYYIYIYSMETSNINLFKENINLLFSSTKNHNRCYTSREYFKIFHSSRGYHDLFYKLQILTFPINWLNRNNQNFHGQMLTVYVHHKGQTFSLSMRQWQPL